MASILKDLVIAFALVMFGFWFGGLFRWVIAEESSLIYMVGLWIGLTPFFLFWRDRNAVGVSYTWKDWLVLGACVVGVSHLWDSFLPPQLRSLQFFGILAACVLLRRLLVRWL